MNPAEPNQPDSSPFPTDAELLSGFLTQSDPTAFTQLLDRHGPMVLGVCRRVLRNRSDAEDAFQAVFLVLAMRAASIRDPHNLPGWLWSVARQTALKVRTSAGRRQATGQHLAELTNMSSETLSEAPPDPDLQSTIESELERLAPKHRSVVVMCYMEGISNRDAARALGLPIGTLVSRLREAREILRKRLARRGYGFDSESLPERISNSLSPAVLPAALVSSTASAVAHFGASSITAAASHSSLTVAKSVVKLMAYSKAKSAVVGALIVLLTAGGSVTLVYRLIRTSDVAASPPAPSARHGNLSNWPATPQSRPAYTGPAISGVVRLPDGRPAVGAIVEYGTDERPAVQMFHGAFGPAERSARTGADGHFQLVPNEVPITVLARTADLFGMVYLPATNAPVDITIRPLGKVEGIAKYRSTPAAGAHVQVRYLIEREHGIADIANGPGTTTAADGHFAIDHVIPGSIDLSLSLPNDGGESASKVPLTVTAGATTTANLGGGGRVVVGRFVPPMNVETRHIYLGGIPPKAIQEIFVPGHTLAEKKVLLVEARKQPAVDLWYKSPHPSITARAEPDGRFRFEDVQPGQYILFADYFTMPDINAHAKIEVAIPQTPPQATDAPFDLGDRTIIALPRLVKGKPVPALEGVTANGNTVRLADYRGKYLLFLIVRSAANDWSNSIEARAIQDRFRDDPRVQMLTLHYGTIPAGISLDGVDWPVAAMGEYRDQLPAEYYDTNARIILIDPDGNFIGNATEAAGAMQLLDQSLASNNAKTTSDHALVQVSHLPAGAVAQAPSFPASTARNLATSSILSIVDGIPTKSANAIPRLIDGRLPATDDAPAQSFFFEVGTLEGRLKMDFGKSANIAQIETYSRHKSTRAPQLYFLYASDGATPAFDPNPKIGVNLAAHGWTKIATVDTRPKAGPPGGQYTVKISNPSGPLGTYRYLLFEMFPTETQDAYGHTFYNEIRVLEKP